MSSLIFLFSTISLTLGILDGTPRNFFKSLKTDSNLFQMVQTYPSMSLRAVVSVIKLMRQNLENTELLTKFLIICLLIPLTLSTRSDALPKMTQSGKHGIFRGIFTERSAEDSVIPCFPESANS